MRISDWSSDVCSSDLGHRAVPQNARRAQLRRFHEEVHADREKEGQPPGELVDVEARGDAIFHIFDAVGDGEGQFLHLRRAGFLHMIAGDGDAVERSEEHTSELQSLMRISYAVFCLKKTKQSIITSP